MKKIYKVIVNGEKVEMTYEDICHKLGFIPEVEFVKVTTRGTITYTLGKPHEIRALRAAVDREGMVAARTLHT